MDARTLTTRPSLVDRLRGGGDDESWEQFVSIYAPLIERLGARRGLGAEARDALVQDFLVRALEALPRFRYDPGRGRFRDWVRTVALNELRQKGRARASYERALERCKEDVRDAYDERDELEAWWIREERRRLLELALERLGDEVSPTSLGAFRLVAIEGRPVAEVAEFYGLRKNHVSVLKCRLLQKLRATVARIQEELS